MTQIVFAFHCVLVFGVPGLFGWVLLRRVVREHDLAVLVPGAVIIGCVALMALVNELRYWLEMAPAVWFAYKLLLSLTLAFLLVTRPPRQNPMFAQVTRRGWQVALLALGIITVGVYFGYPASQGILNDAWWFHYPEAVQIQTIARFPLPHPFALDGPLYYHFGPDILAAIWSFLLELPVQQSFALNIALFAPATFCLAFALTLRLSRSYFAALAAACFVVVGGNLRFLNIFGAELGNAAARIQVFNSQSIQSYLQMVFTPSHALGIPLMLSIVLLFRHFLSRPGWPLAAVLGLTLGTLTLVAEWYFFPLAAVLGLVSAWHYVRTRRHRSRAWQSHLAVFAAPLMIASAWGLYNNTYVAGMIGHFWMRYPDLEQRAYARLVTADLGQRRHPATLPVENAPGTGNSTISAPEAGGFDWPSLELPPLSLSLGHGGQIPEPSLVYPGSMDPIVPGPALVPPAGSRGPGAIAPGLSLSPARSPYVPRWTAPGLIPLRLNLAHIGQIPSWEGAGSDHGTWVPTWSWAFLAEIFPVLCLGLPFGWLLWRRTRNALVLTLAGLALLCAIPPVLLDWGFRSTDFLRFFTGAFTFSALLLGLLVGRLLQQPGWRGRRLGISLIAITLVNAAGLGVLGLIPSTLATAKTVGSQGASLSQMAKAAAAPLKPPAPSIDPASSVSASARLSHAAAFTQLAADLDRFLFPLTLGRERAIVIVPPDNIAPLQVFPEWMKLATLSRLLLPVGWYWNDSLYASYYKDAVRTLDARAVAALDARWVIVTNLWDYPTPEAVVCALNDRSRFVPAGTFVAGPYHLSLYRAF